MKRFLVIFLMLWFATAGHIVPRCDWRWRPGSGAVFLISDGYPPLPDECYWVQGAPWPFMPGTPGIVHG